MISVFVFALVVGVAMLGWWIIAERRRGASASAVTIRRVIAGLMAFGLGGLSASYSGLSIVTATVLALAAAVAMVWYSDSVGA